MGSFIEDFFFGDTDPETGEPSGGLVGSFLDTPFAQFWGGAAKAVGDTPVIGPALSIPVRGATSGVMFGLESAEFLESYVLSRPVSTVLQSLSVSNPLYRNGVQVDDFVRMWNASEYISPGRAGLTNIGSGIGMIETIARGGQDPFTGGADWNEFSYGSGYDPYSMSPEELEKTWDDSPLGTVGSTFLDTAFVVVAGGKGVNAAASGMKRAAGLSTTIKSQKDLTRLRQQGEAGILWKESGGTQGRSTPFFRDIDEVAQTDDYATIRGSALFTNWSRSGSFNADELAEQFTKINDPRLIMDIALADRGDVVAIGRLFKEAPDSVWSLMDMTDVMQKQFAAGGQFVPDVATARIYNQTFESAVDRDEFWRSVKNTFMVTEPNSVRVTAQPGAGVTITMQQGQDSGGLIAGVRAVGSDTMPIGSLGVRGVSDVSAYADRWLKRTMANARINRPNSWNEIPLGGRRGRAPMTKLLFWAGSRRPNNMIEFNSMRPDEIVDEMVAYSRSSRALRQKEWTVARVDADGIPVNVTMRDYEWRSEALARLGAAKSQGDQPLAAVVRELETELISVVANKYRVSADEASRIASTLRNQSDSYQAQVARDGYWIDADGVRTVVDPVTKRQLANSMVLMPLDDIDWALREGSTTSFARRGRGVQSKVVKPTQAVLDTVYKFFRTNVLFRPGYVPKNSIGEPAVAALLADASLVPEGGLLNVTGRVGKNTARRSKQFTYGIVDRLPKSPARRDMRRLDQLRDEYEYASRQLEELELRIDDLNSSASPATRAKYLNVAENERRVAFAQLKDVERRMDIADPLWRDVEELPTYTGLKNRIQLIDNAVNDPEFVVTAQARINTINASRSGGARDAALADEISSIQTRLAELQSRKAGLDEQKSKLARRGDALFAGRADVPVSVKRKDLVDPDKPDARVTPDWIEQLARLNDPRKFNDKLRKSVPDPVDRRRVEALIRSIRYIDDQIGEQQRLLKNLEESRGSLRPLNDVDAAEIAELERLLALNARVAAGEVDPKELLTGLRASLEDIRQATFRVEPNAVDRKMALEAQIAKLDGERRKLTDSIARRNLARERSRKRAFSGEEDITVRGPSGTEYRVAGTFSEEPGQFGAALRVDSSANMTAYQTASGGARSGSRWRQAGDGEAINPFDARYWDELAYVANRHVMGDDFAVLFLQGKTQGEIISWLKSPAGREYRKQMGWTQDDIYGEASVIVRTQQHINDYFPNAAVKARLLEGGEVTPGQLQKLMGNTPLEELSPIYGTGLEFVGNPLARINRTLNNVTDTIWRNLAASPESRFGRWPFMQREYRRQMERQIALAEQQGLVLTKPTLEAMQRTSRSRALKEMENTFYNIRRMAGPIYAMRYFMGFPAAAYNTAYRYGRLAYRSPGNAVVQANAWQSALVFMGVDEEGNETDSWQDVDTIVFSVPEEWNLPIDPKIKVKAESIYLGAQEGSFLPTVTVPISSLMMYKPELDQYMRDEFPDLYETMFGYGTGTDPDFSVGPIPIDPFLGSYQKKLIKTVGGIFSDIPDEDYARVAIQDWQYRMFEWHKNGEVGPIPEWEDSAKNARDYYGIGTLVSFLAFGSYRISPEGQFYRDEWFRIREKHPGDFPAAQREMLDLYGPSAWYLMRPTSKNRAGMPATAEGFEIYQQHQDLLVASREINPKDPSMVSQLMFLDARAYKDSDFSSAVYDWQFRNSLPGDTEPIAARLSPQEIEDDIKIAESWAYYNDAVAKRDALMLEYGYTQLRPDGDSDWLYQSWTEWYEGFRSDPDNRLWVAERGSPDTTKALRVLDGLDEFLSNKKWMSGPGSSITWTTISEYRSELDNARAAYDVAEDPETRRRIAEEWDSYVRYWFLPQAGNFSDYYERFLAGRDLSGKQLLDREFDIPQYPISIGAFSE